MNLVDEQQLMGLQVDQQANDVAGALQGRGAGDAAAHSQLLSQHQSHGGFAQARWAVEQHVVEGLLAGAGGLHRDGQHLLELALADVIGKALGTETVLPGQATGCGGELLEHGSGIHKTRWWLVAAGAAAGRRRSRGDDGHAARVPGAP